MKILDKKYPYPVALLNNGKLETFKLYTDSFEEASKIRQANLEFLLRLITFLDSHKIENEDADLRDAITSATEYVENSVVVPLNKKEGSL